MNSISPNKRLSRSLTVIFLIACFLILSLLAVVYFGQTDAEVTLSLDGPLAYTYRDAYSPEEVMPVHIHTNRTASAQVVRLGRILEPTYLSFDVGKVIQDNTYNYRKGFDWDTTKNLSLKSLKSGYYFLHLREKASRGKQRTFNMPFIVKPRKATPIAVIASTNTWQAYNHFAGLSNYRDYRDEVRYELMRCEFPRCFFYKVRKKVLWNFRRNDVFRSREMDGYVPLPRNRPYDFLSHEISKFTDPKARHHSHLLRAEWPLVAFLEENGLEYGVYSDFDVFSDPSVFESDVVIFNTHSEYWSSGMISKLEKFLARGGKVIFASGNNIYREVEFDQWGLKVVNQSIDKKITLHLTGAVYDKRGLRTFSSYTVKDASHWVFDQTQVKNGDIFGAKSSNGSSSFFGPTGASGFETDKMDQEFSSGMLLAKGNNEGEGGADMVFANLPNGGWVFNASSITFTGALDDKVIRRIMLNLINRAIEEQTD